MKTKNKSKSKAHSKSKANSKSKTHTKTGSKTHASHQSTTTPHAFSETIVSSTPSLNTTLKTCQEVEVGDIGGFGSPEELEEHEKRCKEPATEFCSNCGRSLCRNHYELIHRDHDRMSHPTGSSPA